MTERLGQAFSKSQFSRIAHQSQKTRSQLGSEASFRGPTLFIDKNINSAKLRLEVCCHSKVNMFRMSGFDDSSRNEPHRTEKDSGDLATDKSQVALIMLIYSA